MVKSAFAGAGIAGLAVLTVFLAMTSSAWAQTAPTVASDRAAGYVIFPKIVSDPGDLFTTGHRTETLVQLTNLSSTARVVECFYVDATTHCTSGTSTIDPIAGTCRTRADCTGNDTCDPSWSETNFFILLSPNQPEGWLVSGSTPVDSPGVGLIKPVPENFFVGELKCVQVDGTSISGGTGTVATTDTPINANDLKGEATIYDITRGAGSTVDVRSYNAIGVQAVSSNGATQTDKVMCLGANTASTECAVAEYASCPATLILNHFFDASSGGNATRTDLTLVPCSENLAVPTGQTSTAVQFLVFNEFEQRFSASTRFNCFVETQLSLIDSRTGQESNSIFNIAVEGTLTGQTRIRGVMGGETNTGHGLLGVAEEFRTVSGGTTETGSAAFNLNYAGTNPNKADFVRLP